MRRVSLLGLVFGILLWLPGGAQASVVAKINKSTQTMDVYVNGVKKHTWKVSTGRRGYNTPVGQWRPKWLSRMHYSRKYNNSPMPYSIFYKGGFAIHGTNYVKRLGRRASHGCVRLRTSNARILFSLVRKYGKNKTKIIVANSSRSGKAAGKPVKKKKWRKKALKRKIVAVEPVKPAKSVKPVKADQRVRVILSDDFPRREVLTEARTIIRGPLL